MRRLVGHITSRYSRDWLFWLCAFTVLVVTPTMLALAAGAILQVRSVLAEERQVVAEASAVRGQTRDLLLTFADAEAAQRGWLLSPHEPSLRARARAARKEARVDLDALAARLDARPDERANAAALRTRAEAVLAAMERVETAQARLGRGSAARAAAGPALERATGELRRQTQRILDDFAARAQDSQDRLRRQASRTDRLVAFSIAMAGLALAVAGVMAFRYTAMRTKLIEGAQAEADRRRSIFDSAMDAIITIRPTGEIDSLNKAAEQMFGYDEAELLGRDVSILAPLPLDAPAPAEGEEHLGACEYEGRRKDGSTLAIDVNLGAMPQPDGVHRVAVMRDCTQRKQAERAKDEFISTVSHELRTPLTSIAGSLGLLAGGAAGPLPQTAGRLVGIAESNSRRLMRLINDLLEIQKIHTGRMKLARTRLDFAQLVGRAVDAMAGLQSEHQVRFAYVPAGPAPVQGDPDRLTQVVANLLSNAAKFSPPEAAVEVALSARDGAARLEVRDRGPGVPPEFRDRIFGRFAQADSSDTRARSGTGLGLAISKEIVEAHGGRIWFESPPGEGATFLVELPLAA